MGRGWSFDRRKIFSLDLCLINLFLPLSLCLEFVFGHQVLRAFCSYDFFTFSGIKSELSDGPPNQLKNISRAPYQTRIFLGGITPLYLHSPERERQRNRSEEDHTVVAARGRAKTR